MSFGSTATSKEQYQHHQHFNNKSEFISPPFNSKQQQFTFHNSPHRLIEEDCWDSASTEEFSMSPSSPSSSSSSSCSSVTMNDPSMHIRKKKKMSLSNILNNDDDTLTFSPSPSVSAPFSSSRKKQKPIQSLPSSTEGAFFIPAFTAEDTTKLLPPLIRQRQISTYSTLSSIPRSCRRSHSPTARTSKWKQRQLRNRGDCAPYTAIEDHSFSYVLSAPKITNNNNGDDDYQGRKHLLSSIISSNIPPLDNKEAIVATAITSSSSSLSNQIGDSSNSLANAIEGEVVEDPQINKKAKTNAAYIFDNLSADCDQSVLFMNSEEWIPKLEVFDRRPMVRISWKGNIRELLSPSFADY